MATDEEMQPDVEIRRLRMQDSRVALVRIRHRLQRIQDEMESLKERQQRSLGLKSKSGDR